ncbi:hypothetical protein RhiirC2_843889 [Rhizophagus irregularis]|uniref:Uncharacterized protein n=1 Tax=Rhizophagus irregularis TaxID=588596 RepID=A0A2N1NVN3_9GLOM|nr:hypothetical protein RhiirC2_843889 [Rhizophagus irregularis]
MDDLILVKIKKHSGDIMNEIVDKLVKNISNNSCYFNNRKFIKTLMNTRVTAEWSILKSNGHEIPINWNELIWLPRCNATNAWEKARNIGKKDKLNESENMNYYFKSFYQQIKQLKQNKQQSKKNNLSDLQKDQMVVFGDTSFELDSVKSHLLIIKVTIEN